jgi:class 3 adenylate cyclase
MQSVAKENQIIIGETAYMQVKEAFNCRKVGDVVLKNKMNPTPLYEVLD